MPPLDLLVKPTDCLEDLSPCRHVTPDERVRYVRLVALIVAVVRRHSGKMIVTRVDDSPGDDRVVIEQLRRSC